MDIEEKIEGTFTGRSIEEAKGKAVSEFGVDPSLIDFEVINDVKKGLFGKIKEEAKVYACCKKAPAPEKPAEVSQPAPEENPAVTAVVDDAAPAECCRNYIMNILDKMGIEAEVTVKVEEGTYSIEIDSKGSGAVIGRRGETLDALQYLTSLVVNKFEGDYRRVTLDSCGYRSKREETLIQLANKICQKALKTGRATTLEPMNPYERRIIHSAVAKVEGVNSKSVGEEPYRKVIISSDHPRKNDGRRGGYRKRRGEGPRSLDLKTSFEKDYKKPKPEDNINAGLYGKIEI